MSDTSTNGAAAGAETPVQPRLQVLGQFIKDMSFENIAAQKALTGEAGQPDIQVNVNLDAKKREGAENQFEVSIKLKIEAKTKTTSEMIFVIELDYSGIFLIENVPNEQMHPFLLIECPRMIFPFVRRIVSDISRDGGFPPLNLETIDFIALYRQDIQRRAAAQAAAAPQN